MSEEDTSGPEVSPTDAQPGETYEQRVHKRMRKEIEEADQPWIRAQKLTDHLWEQKLLAEAPLDDGMVEIAGFRVPRYRTSCHVGKDDPDYGEH